MLPIHALLICYALFVTGFGLHTLKSAQNAVTHKTANTIGQWFVYYGVIALIRFAFATAAFFVYTTDPALTNHVFGWLGFNAAYTLPVTVPTAFIYGFFADNVLDVVAKKVPWLAQEIPSE